MGRRFPDERDVEAIDQRLQMLLTGPDQRLEQAVPSQ